MDKIVIAVDANILFSALITENGVVRRFLTLSLLDERVELHLSSEVLNEINRHLPEISRKSRLPIPAIVRTLHSLTANISLTQLDTKMKDYAADCVNDIDDAHVALLALTCDADYLLTYNTKHFRQRKLSPKGIKIRTPPQLLRTLGYSWTDLLNKKRKHNLDTLWYSTRLRKP